jgi:hypothetical protein
MRWGFDHRRWFGHDPEFASVIGMGFVFPSELDLLELGHHAAMAICQEAAEQIETGIPWYYRVKDPGCP